MIRFTSEMCHETVRNGTFVVCCLSFNNRIPQKEIIHYKFKKSRLNKSFFSIKAVSSIVISFLFSFLLLFSYFKKDLSLFCWSH